MFELAPNTPASVNLFTCPIKPLKDFLFSIPSKDGEENPSKTVSSAERNEFQYAKVSYGEVISLP